MSYGPGRRLPLRCWPGGKAIITLEGNAMNVLKSQTFRIVMILSVMASSSLVLMAGRRW